MKRSELKDIGSYRLTPDSWGDPSVMIDEEAAAQSVAVAFNLEFVDPDEDENDRPEEVELAVRDGEFFVISAASLRGGRKTVGLFRPCEDPAQVKAGTIFLFGKWEEFEEEEDS